MSFAYPQVVDYNQPRGRALSWDGAPMVPQYAMQQPVMAPVQQPRYYASNQPGYTPGWGNSVGGGWGVSGVPQYTAAPAPYCAPAPQYGYQTYAPPPQPVANSQVCCPLPGPTEDPAPSQSAHAFQSNAPAGQCEGLVSRNVEYQTEWVAVPVQKPIVYETYQRVVEIPTQHLVNVQNVPGGVPPRQCDPPGSPTAMLAPTSYGVAPGGYAQPAMSTSPVPWGAGPAMAPGRLGRTFSY